MATASRSASASLARAARRQAAALWGMVLTAQLMVIALTRVAHARLRLTDVAPESADRRDAANDAGFTLVEWVIMLVVVAAAAATVATLIYNWITNKAKGVTDNQQ